MLFFKLLVDEIDALGAKLVAKLPAQVNNYMMWPIRTSMIIASQRGVFLLLYGVNAVLYKRLHLYQAVSRASCAFPKLVNGVGAMLVRSPTFYLVLDSGNRILVRRKIGEPKHQKKPAIYGTQIILVVFCRKC